MNTMPEFTFQDLLDGGADEVVGQVLDELERLDG